MTLSAPVDINEKEYKRGEFLVDTDTGNDHCQISRRVSG